MRKFLTILFAIFASAATLHAQDTPKNLTMESIHGPNVVLAADPVHLTKAPKGYKPFYITHFGRHGARHAWQTEMYDSVKEVFDRASGLGVLTEKGKEFKRRLDVLYPEVRYRGGELTRKGWDQQKALGRRMYANYPEVFKGKVNVEACSSVVLRCVMSMSAFCQGLLSMNPDIYVHEAPDREELYRVNPLDKINPYIDRDYERVPVSFPESNGQIAAKMLEGNTIFSQLFTDVDAVIPAEDVNRQLIFFYMFVTGMPSLDVEASFVDLFTLEDLLPCFLADNADVYRNVHANQLGFMGIANDMVKRADEHIASGERGADLRFSHDSVFGPLMSLLGFADFDCDVKSPEEIVDHFQTYDIPMGANCYFVFYRGKKADAPILFKPMLNGKEAHLNLETDCWPYYKWEDFKAYLKQK